MKKKLLITGASGFLGHHLMQAAVDMEVYGIYNKRKFNFSNSTPIPCDLTDYITLGNYFEDIEPDAVIHAAAISDANFCQQNRELSYRINVEATKNIAGICSDYRIPFVFTSSDLVFDGKKGMYREEDETSPMSIYGEQKAIAEKEVLDIYPEALVCRLPLMFGLAEGATNYLQRLIEQIRNGETVNLFTNEFRSICGARSIAKGILHLMDKATGLLHVAGKERLSRFEFGMMVAGTFALPTEKIRGCSQSEVKMSAPRPADVSLDISKALKLGYSPMGVEEELNLLVH